MTDKELDDLFQKTLAGHQMPVPPGMWERVNPQKDKRRRAVFFWWSGLGIAALLMLTGTAVWMYHTAPGNNNIVAAKQVAPQQDDSLLKEKEEISEKPAEATTQSGFLGSSDHQSSSAQAVQQADSKGHDHTLDLYSNQSHSYQSNHNPEQAIISQHQNSAISQPGNDNTNKPGNIQANSSQNEVGNETALPNATETNVQSDPATASAQKPDSNNTVSTKPAAQESKTEAIKVKKIHGEKAASVELMVAGYGNSRNVYDASLVNTAGLIAFGPVNTKEKVLMHSFSINARIDKPLTRNLSLKIGLQFLQTHQRVNYSYETVFQSSVISAASNDTTFSARLQSKESVVKGTYNSLNIPVLVSYHTNGAKLNVGATAGVMLNVLSWYGGRVPDAGSNEVVSAKSTFRRHAGISLYSGLTVSKQLGSFQLFAEPHIQYTLSSVTKSTASFRQKITGYGFGIGIRKSIGK